METKNALERMSNAYHRLTRSGRKIADYILAHRTEAQYMSITALAEECGVADATVSRFCRTLGFDGYNDFKLALAKAVGVPAGEQPGVHGQILPEDSITELGRKLYAADTAAIAQTLALMDEDAVRRAVELLSAARRVYCFGQGGSMVMAMEAWARFATVAAQFQCIQDSHMQAMAASLADEQDVILYISYSGSTKDMMDVLRLARERGVKIVLVTHFAKSPAASESDVVLLCGSKEGPLQSGSVAAKMALLFVIDILFHEYCRANPELTDINRETTANALANKLL